jgi:zinc/manganese transport system permease protein
MNKGKTLITAWIIGTCVNLVSIIVSYNLDLPTGYTLVFSHALLALIVSIAAPVKQRTE